MKYFPQHTILHILLFPLFLEPTLVAQTSQESLAIIVHESVETNEIDLQDLIAIYTLSKHQWADGARIRLADYKGSKTIRTHFYDALNTNSNNIKKIWLRAQFTGRSIPPKVVRDEQEMLQTIIENPGTIGYVPQSFVPANTKVLLIIND